MPSIREQIELWKTQLLDLSRRNRLLHLRIGQPGTIDLLYPSTQLLFDDLVRRRKRLPFIDPLPLEERFAAVGSQEPVTGATVRLDQLSAPEAQEGRLVSDLAPEVQVRRLYNLRLKARQALTDQGVNLLYLAFGFLEWYAPQEPETIWRSPLLLIPVEIQRASLGNEFALRIVDDEIVLNPTLVHKLRQDFNIRLPDMPLDSEDLEITTLFDQISSLVKEHFDWDVVPDVTLGLFSFSKLLMYNDLRRIAPTAEEHPILKRFASSSVNNVGVSDAEAESVHVLPDSLLSKEQQRPPEEVFQVLDADSSQLEAIAAAREGLSFVLQGPPGTGKSQTITNIIAESLAQGKRVLFVSEKMAALQVVYERLREAGLSEFCLELHSHKASKRAVLDSLGAVLDQPLATTPSHFPYGELRSLREQLDDYAHALHSSLGALGWTAYTVYGRMAALSDAPDYEGPLLDVMNCSSEQLGAIDTLLVKLDLRRELLAAIAVNPWRGSASLVGSFEERGRVRSHLRSLQSALSDLIPLSQRAGSALELPVSSTLGAARSLAKLAGILRESYALPANWLEDRDWLIAKGHDQVISEAREQYQRLIESEAQLFTRYRPELLQQDLDALQQRFAAHAASWFSWFQPQYHQDMKLLRSLLKPGVTLSFEQVASDLALAQQVRERQAWQQESAPILNRFAPLFTGRTSNWDQLLQHLDWFERLKTALGDQPITAALLSAASQPLEARAALLSHFSALDSQLALVDQEIAFLKTYFPADDDPRMRSDLWALDASTRSKETPETLWREPSIHPAYLLEHMAGLDNWWEWSDLRKSAESIGLEGFLDGLVAAGGEAVQAPRRAFHKRFCQLWLDAACRSQPALRSFQYDQHESMIERFRQLDKSQLLEAQASLRGRLQARRPAPGQTGTPTSELGVLRRELQKQRRHKPIRQLLHEIPTLLGQLKPCLMMSPLSVSQFLDPEAISFDLVIFDEASQIRTEEAVGAIMRGASLIVVGDNKQLPPTSFFQISDDEPEDDDESLEGEPAERFESVLDAAAAAAFPIQMLRWHYRSRHESLITFSNSNFYHNRLATFPAAQHPPHMGISFHHVPDAFYDRKGTRTNLVEARYVADLVCEHIRTSPERSLGVVTFSQAQQLAILNELERRHVDDPSLALLFDEDRPNPFFVKNLENVQGDERQVMIISVAYGRDKQGRLLMNFGPLNRQGGERRLNVAITRAREQMIVVSSILPEDIDLRRINQSGPRLLRSYLEYARQGGPAPAGRLISPDGDPVRLAPSQRSAAVIAAQFEDDLATALAQQGLVLQRQVGHSDFRIDIAICDPDKPEHYLLGVECDGSDYRAAATTRDRERLREEVLAQLGWRIHRAWSGAWAQDPEHEIGRVLEALASRSSASAASD
jgi:very-short-patch-repair endonuclease